ncbi:hypothetical protein BOC49_10985 [Burkholderia pseudomallei]|nr:hypothetical protein BOC49_10985 [Burkholderia pseudomallei]
MGSFDDLAQFFAPEEHGVRFKHSVDCIDHRPLVCRWRFGLLGGARVRNRIEASIPADTEFDGILVTVRRFAEEIVRVGNKITAPKDYVEGCGCAPRIRQKVAGIETGIDLVNQFRKRRFERERRVGRRCFVLLDRGCGEDGA